MKKAILAIMLLILFFQVTACDKKVAIVTPKQKDITLAINSISDIKINNSLEKGQLTVAEAKKQIEDYLNFKQMIRSSLTEEEIKNGVKKLDLGEVVGVDIPEAWDKMKLQGFHSKNLGDFIIQGKDVIDVFMLVDATIVDLDGDGSFELINMCGFGSGIYRININVYKDGKSIASNCWVPNNGFQELSLEKIDDRTVKLRGLEVKGAERALKEDYGKLVLKAGVIEPSNTKNFKFKTWLIDSNFEKTIDEKLKNIVNTKNINMGLSSNPYDYIKFNEDYYYIVSQGTNALNYMLSKFDNSDKNGLEEYIMAIACSTILKEDFNLKKWATGREWYNNYLKNK